MSTENEVSNASNNEEVIEPSYEINSWEDLDLPIDLLRGIYSYGFEKPSPIQQKAIKPIMMGRDIIAQAQSGTGKTATFSIGALSKIDMEKNATQVLILSPTRELTSQTSKVITFFIILSPIVFIIFSSSPTLKNLSITKAKSLSDF